MGHVVLSYNGDRRLGGDHEKSHSKDSAVAKETDEAGYGIVPRTKEDFLLEEGRLSVLYSCRSVE